MTDSLTSDPSSPRFQEETRGYLQRRLRLLAGAVAGITGILLVAFAVMSLIGGMGAGQLVRDFVIAFPNAVLFWMVALTAGMYVALKRRSWSPVALGVIDALLLWTMIVPCLLLYSELHHYSFSGFAAVVPFLTLFVLTRAVFVPSSALRTALLSAPAALGVLAIQLAQGGSFASPGEPFGASHFTDQLVQNQVILLGTVAIAALASNLNLSLRRTSYDASKLGQYDLHEMIGSGGMGEVYRATHSLLKRETAVKMIRAEASGKDVLNRFEREVRQTSRLTHPNTIAIFDYGHTANGVFYYAMELLDGADLRRIVEYDGPLPAGRVIHILEQACGALSEAHKKGMVHRDVKPANLMLCERGGVPDVVKLLDFGLVRDFSAAMGSKRREDKMLAGTPETMPPEVMYPDAVGPRSDLYSLGCVAYYMLSGQPVFKGKDTRSLIRMHQSVHPEQLTERNPDVPQDLAKLVHRCLAKSMDQRPNDAAGLRDELLRCADAGSWTTDDATVWWKAHGQKLAESIPIREGSTGKSAMSTMLLPQDSRLMDRRDVG